MRSRRPTRGQSVCLSNVCCHRGASLAQGKCHGDDPLACSFHGWRFNPEGRCTLVPAVPLLAGGDLAGIARRRIKAPGSAA